MRQKVRRLVIAFHTTAEAMAVEKFCNSRGLEGKLVSVPRSITSDCGLAWSAPEALHGTLEPMLADAGIETAGAYLLSL